MKKFKPAAKVADADVADRDEAEEDNMKDTKAAARNGNGVKVLKQVTPAIVTPSVSPEETLMEEYHDLVDSEMEGDLSEAQAARLREVQTQLDALDEQDSQEQAINARIRQTRDELDAMLTHLQSLPEKVSQG